MWYNKINPAEDKREKGSTMKDMLNDIVNKIKDKKVLYGIIIGVATLIILTTSIVVGSVIASKLTCAHDNPYEIEILPYKVATCLEEGLTMGKKCNYCGKIVVAQEAIPKRNCDSKVTVPYKAPTCVETGWTAGKSCSVCGKVTEGKETLDKVECIESAWIVDKYPTSSENGAQHVECTVCGKIIKQEIIPSGAYTLDFTTKRDSTIEVTGIGSCLGTDIVIPSEHSGMPVKSIGYNAFGDCVSLTSVSIPNSVTNIGFAAFSGCTSLEYISIPDSITSVGLGAFTGCASLQYNKYGNANYLGNENNPYIVLVEVERFDAGGYEIHSDTKIIYGYAFAYRKLTSVTIPSSVIFIGSGAFNNCTTLTTIHFEGTVEQWNAIEFGDHWNYNVPATEVICSDGTVPLN